MRSSQQQTEQIVIGSRASLADGEKKSPSLQTSKKQAKLSLTLCLGVLVATGFGKSKTARHLHIAAGATLVGLSIWHHSLYSQPARKK